MTADALLAEILRRADFIFAGWNVLLITGVALVAVVGAVPALRQDVRLSRLLMATFAFFALTHLLGMLHVVKQWASLTDALAWKIKDDPTLAERIDFAVMAPHISWIVPFHFAFDLLVLGGVAWLSRRRNGG